MNTKMHLSLLLFFAILLVTHAGEPTEKLGARDSYQWNEEPKSVEAGTWLMHRAVDAQVSNHPEIAKGLTELIGAARLTIPCEKGGVYFFTKSSAKGKSSSIYLRKGYQGNDELLIDGAKVSPGKNTALAIFHVPEDARLLVYGAREGEAKEQTVRVFDLTTRADLPDVLPKARYNTASVSPDGKGCIYTKVESTGTRVYFHKFGSQTATDKLVFGDTYNYEPLGPKDLISTEVTENGHYLLFSVARGEPAKRVDIYSQELAEPDQRVRPIIHAMENHFSVVNHGEDLFVLTDNEAPKKRVVKIVIDDPHPLKWTTIVPEGTEVISDIAIVGDKLFVSSSGKEVTRTRIFTLEGQQTGEVTFPAIGSAPAVQRRCPH